MKILIRNLNRTTTSQQVKELFESFGTVESCTLVMDSETGESKGFGFVQMPIAREAKSAIHNLNNRTLDDHRIRVKQAEVKKD